MCTKIKKKFSRELVVAQLLPPSSPPSSPSSPYPPPTLRSSHSSVPSSPLLSSSSSANNNHNHCYCLRPAAAAARHHHRYHYHPIITHHNNNNNGTSTIWSLFQHRLFFLSLFLITFSLQSNEAALLQGCDFGNELCTESELCIPDGLFGQCYSDSEAALVRPLTLDAPLTDLQMEVLQAELARLAAHGLDWPHARSQCVLAYFKLAVAFQLDYDTEFCAVRDPANIWALVQRVQNALLAEEEKRDDEDQRGDADVDDEAKTADNAANDDELMEIDEGANVMMGNGQQQQQPSAAQMMELIPVVLLDGNNEQQQLAGEEEESENNGYELAKIVAMIRPNNNRTATTTMDKRGVQPAAAGEEEEGEEGGLPPLAAGEQKELDTLMHQLLLAANKKSTEEGVPIASNTLSDRQLARLVQFIRQLQTVLQENVVQRMAEEDEQQQQQQRSIDAQNDEQATSDVVVAVDDTDDNANADADGDGGVEQQPQQVFLLKKDTERFNNADMGLANTVHKIVKGGIQRVEGNRVYLRVAAKEDLTEEELYKLIAYLDRKIAAPNRLYFDQFLYENGQLSFRVLRSVPILTESANSATATNTKTNGKLSMQLDSASGVAQAVYKRRKDIQTLAGVRVDETGIGSGQDVVPVERSQRDQLFLPILTVCALTICALLSVLAASLISRRRHKTNAAPLLPQTLDQVAGSSGGSKQLYEQLCRQQHAANSSSPPQGVTVVEAAGAIRSKHSSSSSWPGDEPASVEAANLDIGTGHVLLAFLQKHLDKPDEITTQWESVRDYVASDAQTQVAMKPTNVDKNLDKRVLPYDESRVQLHSTNLIELADQGKGKPAAGDADNTYVNASKIYDSDPKNPAYIAAQAPLESTVSQFWQMVWEQGIGLLVNLCNREETESGAYCKYWPVEGSRQFGSFEVHLVSEHIWSEHYLVRSLYLKNMATQETRTVTQFLFLSWPAGGVPASNKALLEFRRKVNKSYRGRASPVLVHCTNGSGRTGTYILIDMAANRINRGIRELDIAASLEHLRDQRMGMVENEQQFKCVFSCILAHISAIHELQH